jgi:hypothetical protein
MWSSVMVAKHSDVSWGWEHYRIKFGGPKSQKEEDKIKRDT